MEESEHSLLQSINFPDDLKKLAKEDLPQVCRELRQFIIDSVSNNPGHFGASLGVVELTVALHYVYNTPRDLLVWDVGHQAYGHKILTGRKDFFDTNRQYKGISGFPKISESEYDCFGVGHSSTSISAALGMAIAVKLHQEERRVVAIIGDGAMTGGMAYEGLNNTGYLKPDILVILNDNNMAIDPNIGGISQAVLNISKSHTYNRLKDEVWEAVGKMKGLGPFTRRIARKTEAAIKAMLLNQHNLFEAFNFRYFGPVDGHDVIYLTQVLEDLKNIKGPKLLHVLTQKGKGFPHAEQDQTLFHAPGRFDKTTGEIIKDNPEPGRSPLFQTVFGKTLVELAEQNRNIVGITPAMPTGCSMNFLFEKIPDRAFDTGIAEQHAVTFAAGLASRGMIPFCNIYSTFMQRAYDQVIHDVAIQNLHVIFCLDRGGLVGEDGPTHHGVFDLAYMRMLPNMVVAAPMNETELRNMMYTAQLDGQGPFSIRYPRGRGENADWEKPFEKIEVGKARKLTSGNDLAILTIGKPGLFMKEVISRLEKENISVAHYDMRFVKPLDTNILHEIFTQFDKIITVEDGVVTGGFGSAIAEFMVLNGYSCRLKMLGIPDRFIEHGSLKELYRDCGIDTGGICQTAIELAGK